MSFTLLQRALGSGMAPSRDVPRASASGQQLPAHLLVLRGTLKTSCPALCAGRESCRPSGCSPGKGLWLEEPGC